MRYASFIAAAVLTLSAFVTAQAHAYEAAYGQTSKAANIRSGPSDKYEIIGKIGSGKPLHIIGCARTWEWCDVNANDKRGWVAARFLLGNYENNLAGIINYGAKMGIPEIDFEERVYWGTHYAQTSFYKKRYGMQEPAPVVVHHVQERRPSLYIDNRVYTPSAQMEPVQEVYVEEKHAEAHHTSWTDARFKPNNTVRLNN
jgi:uncharacterized protein YraI